MGRVSLIDDVIFCFLNLLESGSTYCNNGSTSESKIFSSLIDESSDESLIDRMSHTSGVMKFSYTGTLVLRFDILIVRKVALHDERNILNMMSHQLISNES